MTTHFQWSKLISEKNVGKMAIASLSILAGALTKANVGELIIASITNKMNILVDHTKAWTDSVFEETFSKFTFEY